MLSKKAVKDIQSLRLKKFRQETGLFVVEGAKMVAEVLRHTPDAVQQIISTEDWTPPTSAKTKTITVSPADLQRLSQHEAPQQVLAVVQQLASTPVKATQGLTIYLDTIQDPGNLGSIIRIADWFGCAAVVCSAGCAELYNPKVISATMGSFLRVPVWYDRKGDWLSQQPVLKIAATLGGTLIHKFSITLPAILMIGNEGNGLSEAALTAASQQITIPKRGGAESLNAAVATGILVAQLVTGNE